MTAEKKGLGMAVLAALTLSACSAHSSIPNPFAEWNGHLQFEPHPNYSKSLLQRNGLPIVLLVGEVSDGRADAPSHKVGVIGSTVMFMASTSGTLVLDQNVSSVVFAALNSQLTADGFRTVSDPHEPHDFEINSVAKSFQLDIVAQDDLNISVDMTLRDAKSGEVLWAGSVEEKSSRFAGVSGDTGNSIVRYFNRSEQLGGQGQRQCQRQSAQDLSPDDRARRTQDPVGGPAHRWGDDGAVRDAA